MKKINFKKEKSTPDWNTTVEIGLVCLNLRIMVGLQNCYWNIFKNWLFLLFPLLLIWLITWVWCRVLIERKSESSFQPVFRIRRITYNVFSIVSTATLVYFIFFP